MNQLALRLAVLAVLVGVMASCYCGCRGDSCYNGCGTCNAILRTGQTLHSRNRQVRVTMQTDGNLVVYCTWPRRAVWASGTFGNMRNVRRGATFQKDGNLVIYSGIGGVLWAANVHNRRGQKMIMQNDANLVMYNNDGNPIWESRTRGQC